MSFMSHPSLRNQLLRGRLPGAPEYGALLDQLSDAALILDRARQIILFANSALVNMTAFTHRDLGAMKFQELVLEDGVDPVAGGDERTVTVKCNNRPYISALLQAAALDSNGQWILVRLIPDYARMQQHWQEMVIQSLPRFSELYNAEDLKDALAQGIEIVQSLFFTGYVAIYQAESDLPRLKREVVYETSPLFPEYLPSSDLIRLSSPETWLPGRHTAAEMHRIARAANLTYLASVPLGQKGAWFGLLVIGDQVGQPSKIILDVMEIVASAISNVMQYFILVTNLRRTNVQSENKLLIRQAIAENVREGILILDRDLRVVEINPLCEEILGYTRQEVLGQQAENIIIGSANLQPALEDARQGIPALSIGQDNQLHRRDGVAFPAQVQIQPVMKNNQLLAVLVFLIDDSEHERIKTRTQQLQQRAFLGEVMEVFAHEVGNPLNNLALHLEVMSEQLGEGDARNDLINKMQGDIGRVKNLMDSVLASSRPLEPRFETMNLIPFLKRLLDRWRPRLARVNVELFFKSPEQIPSIRGDPRTLDQVFTNLLSNAMDAMSVIGSKGGTLSVGVSVGEDADSHQEMVEVTVADNGPGIPEENKERIFEAFITTKPRGTGLGLAITRRIVVAHRGNIKVDSFPGGTVFRLKFPTIREGE